jgi:hypothetical protein
LRIKRKSLFNYYCRLSSRFLICFFVLIKQILFSRKLIEHGLVQSKFHIFIGINLYHLAKRSVMKSSVFVLHFDPVTVNHYLLDNHYFFAMVTT